MREVLEIINQIANTSSRNDKERILEENKDNQLLKDVFKFIYNPYILTGISTKKINKDIKSSPTGYITTIYDLMEYLKVNNTGKDFDIAEVKYFIRHQPEEIQDFLRQIATKSLKIGITDGTLNKIYGSGFIPSFEVMLAKKFDEHKNKIKGNFVITKKLDGNRLVVIKDECVVKSFTRTGNQYEGLEQIESEISKLSIDNIVFDGELIADTEGSTHEIYAETTSKARSKGSNKTGLIFHIFDMLPLDEFQNGQSKANCVERKVLLSKLFKENEFIYCREVEPLYIGNDLSMVVEWMKYASEQKWEGLMVNLNAPYICKRTDKILKVKTMSTCDLRVIGFEEGTGRNEGRLGAILVDYKGYAVGVGSGFTDFDRDFIWNNKNLYLDNIVEIQYFEESKNSDGGISLRFPVFQRLREDKTEPSYF